MPWKFWNRRKKKNTSAQSPSKQQSSSVEGIKDSQNPCLRCGACCAFFLVSFPSHEAETSAGSMIPLELTARSSNSRRCMRGTETKHPRCIALEGFIGSRVLCRIYDRRPSTCRAFRRSWENNVGNSLCDRARAGYGLQVFSQY